MIAVLGPAWPDVLWPFQIGFLGSLAAGMGALLALDRGDRRGEIAAAVLLTVALASSSLGIPLFVAAALEILGRPDRRGALAHARRPGRALRRLVPRLRRGQGKASVDNLLSTPAYVAEAAAAAAGAVFGLGTGVGAAAACSRSSRCSCWRSAAAAPTRGGSPRWSRCRWCSGA